MMKQYKLDKSISNSPTINKYKDIMKNIFKLYYPKINDDVLDNILNMSINKRFNNTEAGVSNSYTKRNIDVNLLKIADYIMDSEPIVTSYGTMFMKHGKVPNPMAYVIQSFLDKRSEDKKMMFKFPKGSEEFEKYNLAQQLDKIDSNGIYGTIGQYTSLLYNVNVATSITSQGRALISQATMQFEMFLANNVRFGSLEEVLQFINNICSEYKDRKYEDRLLLDRMITVEECFIKVMSTCGFRWIPTESEMEIIWNILNHCSQEDINRIYYKNNLYEFVSNSKVFNIVDTILHKLKTPLFNSLDIPDEICDEINGLSDIIIEYVYYKYLVIDSIDRCDNMIKEVAMVSDTDSAIVSLDAWYRFIAERISGEEYYIANYVQDPSTIDFDDEMKEALDHVHKYTYDFAKDEIVQKQDRTNTPELSGPNQNIRYSIINILAYILDKTINNYMIEFCKRHHSVSLTGYEIVNISPIGSNDNNEKLYMEYMKPGVNSYKKEEYDRPCKMILKNEFTFKRLMMTTKKKNYASLIGVQEGNIIPETKQLDIKGIEALTKSTKSIKTRKRLQAILLEDVMKAPAIDQLQFVKDIKVFEKEIIDSIKSGSREYFKPNTIKSINAYDTPMRIQGIKASIAWNKIKSKDLPGIDIKERNSIDIAKVIINRDRAESIRASYPEIYNNIINLLSNDENFKGKITAIAIPLDVQVPKWIHEFIDYDNIINDNIGGFPYESIGIQNFNKTNANRVNYTNILSL